MISLSLLSFGVLILLGNSPEAQQYGGSTAGNEYLLGPGDVIEVSVWKDETLSDELMVRPDGKISLSLIGEIRVKGLTIDSVRQEIAEKMDEYVPGAPVTVILRQINYPKVYVVGKVNRPGVFTMTGEPISVLQALALAGGMTKSADTDSIIVIRNVSRESKLMRRGASNAISVVGREVFEFDYKQVSQGENLEQNIRLEPGDTVLVP